MSKASDFANGFASNLGIDGVEWSVSGKKLTLEINNDSINIKYEITLNITKSSNKTLEHIVVIYIIFRFNYFRNRCFV